MAEEPLHYLALTYGLQSRAISYLDLDLDLPPSISSLLAPLLTP